MKAADHIVNHSFSERVFHWLNAAAIIMLVMGGWRIYNASPVFNFRVPNEIILGGWLGVALLWHFAAMWLLVANLTIFLLVGVFSGHFQRSHFPLSPRLLPRDFGKALHGRLNHDIGNYNAVRKTSYVGVLAATLLTIVSGLCVKARAASRANCLDGRIRKRPICGLWWHGGNLDIHCRTYRARRHRAFDARADDHRLNPKSFVGSRNWGRIACHLNFRIDRRSNAKAPL